MNPTRRRRLWLILSGLAGLGVAATLVLTALNQNMQLFISPSDIADGKAPAVGRNFKLGGVVLEGSVKRASDSLLADFVVTDRFRETRVQYTGILPDLFKEGQSVIATGQLRADGTFVAADVLAKHDENYMPKEVAEAIAKAKTRKESH